MRYSRDANRRRREPPVEIFGQEIPSMSGAVTDVPLPAADWKTTQSHYPPLEGGGGFGRDRVAKQVTKVGAGVASTGATVASYAAHTGGVVAIATGAAISATGIGLVAAGAALTLGGMVQGARSWSKTSDHIAGLKAIQAHKTELRCSYCQPGGREGGPGNRIVHSFIAETVLPYIISQKDSKLTRKKVSTFGGGLFVSAYEKLHGLKKMYDGTRGKTRSYYAHVLSVHLITHYCQLADAIVEQLYSGRECDIIKRMNSDAAGDLIMDKTKSG
jgi:hypothetical protein